MYPLVKASITGSIIGNVLLVLGLSASAGGLRYKQQFQPHRRQHGRHAAHAGHGRPDHADACTTTCSPRQLPLDEHQQQPSSS